jgi:hypothetical protein
MVLMVALHSPALPTAQPTHLFDLITALFFSLLIPVFLRFVRLFAAGSFSPLRPRRVGG